MSDFKTDDVLYEAKQDAHDRLTVTVYEELPGLDFIVANEDGRGCVTVDRSEVIALRDKLSEWLGDGGSRLYTVREGTNVEAVTTGDCAAVALDPFTVSVEADRPLEAGERVAVIFNGAPELSPTNWFEVARANPERIDYMPHDPADRTIRTTEPEASVSREEVAGSA